eukprot:1311926-Rhodomonas_salina.2
MPGTEAAYGPTCACDAGTERAYGAAREGLSWSGSSWLLPQNTSIYGCSPFITSYQASVHGEAMRSLAAATPPYLSRLHYWSKYHYRPPGLFRAKGRSGPGPDPYAPTPLLRHVRYGHACGFMALRPLYEMPGTDGAYGATTRSRQSAVEPGGGPGAAPMPLGYAARVLGTNPERMLRLFSVPIQSVCCYWICCKASWSGGGGSAEPKAQLQQVAGTALYLLASTVQNVDPLLWPHLLSFLGEATYARGCQYGALAYRASARAGGTAAGILKARTVLVARRCEYSGARTTAVPGAGWRMPWDCRRRQENEGCRSYNVTHTDLITSILLMSPHLVLRCYAMSLCPP